MKHNCKLSPVQVKTLDALIKKDETTLTTQQDIEKVASSIVEFAIANLPALYPANNELLYLAYAMSKTARKAIDEKTITVAYFLKLLATEKETNSSALRDFGAFGDLHEILARCAFIKSANLIRSSVLTVKQLCDYDCISRRYGKIEFGTNGKTFSQGNALDYLAGDYNCLVYGCYDDYTKEIIYNYCKNEQFEKAIKVVREYSCIFANKYDFLKLQEKRRGAIIAVKSGHVMIQYNDSFYNMFQKAIENNELTTLKDAL